MKKIIATIIILFSMPVFSCPDLIGTWQSSKELSMKYNIANVEMEPHTINFLNNILGVLKVTYKQDKVRIHGAPTKVIEIKGKHHEFSYEEMTFRYEVNSCSDAVIFISDENPYAPSDNSPINFVNPDAYWVPLMPGANIREYFVRLQ